MSSRRVERQEEDPASEVPLAYRIPSAADTSTTTQTPSPTTRSKRRLSSSETPSASMSGTSGAAQPAPLDTDPSGVASSSMGAEDSSMTSSPMGPPPAKKSRTNTPWTPAEEQRLKTMRDAGNSWAEIAKTFPSRTEGSVKKHWYKDMHYAEFAEDESQALLNAIKEYEANKWKAIGAKVGKPAKACEQYAKEHFSGRI